MTDFNSDDTDILTIGMIDCFWDYLEAQPAWAAFGFKQFRMIDGRELSPMRADTELVFAKSDMPAHATRRIEMRPMVIHEPNSIQVQVTLSQTIVLPADGRIGSAAKVAKACEVLMREIYRPLARAQGLDGSRRLTECSIEISDHFRPVRNDSGTLSYWMADYAATLKRKLV